MTFKLGTTKWLSSQTFHNVSMECFPHHVTMAEVGTTNEGPTKRAQDISSLPWGRRGQEQQRASGKPSYASPHPGPETCRDLGRNNGR